MHEREEGRVRTGYATYVLVWLGLMGLTWLSVTVAGIEAGALKIAGPLVIASIKAVFVLAVFMHLKSEHGLTRWVIVIGLIVFIVSGALVFSDVAYR